MTNNWTDFVEIPVSNFEVWDFGSVRRITESLYNSQKSWTQPCLEHSRGAQ